MKTSITANDLFNLISFRLKKKIIFRETAESIASKVMGLYGINVQPDNELDLDTVITDMFDLSSVFGDIATRLTIDQCVKNND